MVTNEYFTKGVPTVKPNSDLADWNPGSTVLALLANSTDAHIPGILSGAFVIIDTAASDTTFPPYVTVNGGLVTGTATGTNADGLGAISATVQKYFGCLKFDYDRGDTVNNPAPTYNVISALSGEGTIAGVYHYWIGNGHAADATLFSYAPGNVLTVYNGFLCKIGSYTGGAGYVTGAPKGDLSACQPVAIVTALGTTNDELIIKFI